MKQNKSRTYNRTLKKELDETNSVWNYFGILASVSDDGTVLVVKSDDGATRKMSRRKYKTSVDNVKEKADALVGIEVEVRTSQATKKWNDDVWFSSIREFN